MLLEKYTTRSPQGYPFWNKRDFEWNEREEKSRFLAGLGGDRMTLACFFGGRPVDEKADPLPDRLLILTELQVQLVGRVLTPFAPFEKSVEFAF